jgi:hypothetical protein
MARHGRRDDIHVTPDVSHIQNPDVTHEESDVNVRAILIFVAGLLFFGAIVHVLMWFMLKGLEQRVDSRTPPPAPMALTNEERLPPEPRLQVAPGWEVELADGQRVDLSRKQPGKEIELLGQQWNEVLEKGQKDQHGQVVSIPIEEAKRQLLEKGLPARPQADSHISIPGGADVPTYQSSGRKMEKRDQ